MEQSLLALAIAGAISGLKQFLPEVVTGWATVVVAVILGALAGFFGVDGLNVGTGILTGLASVGAVTVVDRLNKQ